MLYQVLNAFFHLDVYLNSWAVFLGPWLYVLLFAIIFCETGLVILPFLPGDSLLFAVGALSAVSGSVINIYLVGFLLMIAGIAGDALNYWFGHKLGQRAFTIKSGKFFKHEHLLKTQQFYEKYGGKTIIFARFIPIIRTFAPFVAGIGQMRYSRFALFNVIGGVSWVLIFLTAGHFFGDLPEVKKNFHYVIVGIIIVSALPAIFEFIRHRRHVSRLA